MRMGQNFNQIVMKVRECLIMIEHPLQMAMVIRNTSLIAPSTTILQKTANTSKMIVFDLKLESLVQLHGLYC